MEQDLVAVDPDLVAITMNQPFHYGSIPILKTALEKFAPAPPFAPRRGRDWEKSCLKSFEGQGLIGLCAKFQLSQSPPSCFLSIDKYHIFNK